jgi:D-serine dehydratase
MLTDSFWRCKQLKAATADAKAWRGRRKLQQHAVAVYFYKNDFSCNRKEQRTEMIFALVAKE